MIKLFNVHSEIRICNTLQLWLMDGPFLSLSLFLSLSPSPCLSLLSHTCMSLSLALFLFLSRSLFLIVCLSLYLRFRSARTNMPQNIVQLCVKDLFSVPKERSSVWSLYTPPASLTTWSNFSVSVRH